MPSTPLHVVLGRGLDQVIADAETLKAGLEHAQDFGFTEDALRRHVQQSIELAEHMQDLYRYFIEALADTPDIEEIEK